MKFEKYALKDVTCVSNCDGCPYGNNAIRDRMKRQYGSTTVCESKPSLVHEVVGENIVTITQVPTPHPHECTKQICVHGADEKRLSHPDNRF